MIIATANLLNPILLARTEMIKWRGMSRGFVVNIEYTKPAWDMLYLSINLFMNVSRVMSRSLYEIFLIFFYLQNIL